MPKHIHGPASPVMWLRPLSALFLIRRSIRCGFGLPMKHRRHFVDSNHRQHHHHRRRRHNHRHHRRRRWAGVRIGMGMDGWINKLMHRTSAAISVVNPGLQILICTLFFAHHGLVVAPWRKFADITQNTTAAAMGIDAAMFMYLATSENRGQIHGRGLAETT